MGDSWYYLRKLQQTPGTYQNDPQLPVDEGNPVIFVFWDTWGLFQGSVGFFLDTTNLQIMVRFHLPCFSLSTIHDRKDSFNSPFATKKISSWLDGWKGKSYFLVLPWSNSSNHLKTKISRNVFAGIRERISVKAMYFKPFTLDLLKVMFYFLPWDSSPSFTTNLGEDFWFF